MKGKVLVIGNINEVLIKNLNAFGFQCDYEENINPKKLPSLIEPYCGLVVRTYPVGEAIINAGKNLQFIGRSGSGLDKINITYAKNKNIKVFNSPEGNANAVAEHAVGMILSLLHHINKSDREMRRFIFDRRRNTGTELATKTVGIIGYGNTGSCLAKKLSSFGCNILVFDKYLSNFGNEQIKESTLNEIFETADIVSVHLQGNAETAEYINANFINKFKKPIYLINTSRGMIMNTTDVWRALKSEKLTGVGLDVFENEDLSTITFRQKQMFKKIARSNKTIVTPHVAGWSTEAEFKIANILSKKIIAFYTDKLYLNQ